MRFNYITICSHVETPLDIGFVFGSGEDDNRDITQPLVQADNFEDFKAVQHRHVQIENDELGYLQFVTVCEITRGKKLIQGFLATPKGNHITGGTVFAQGTGDKDCVTGVILNHKYVGEYLCRSRAVITGACVIVVY